MRNTKEKDLGSQKRFIHDFTGGEKMKRKLVCVLLCAAMISTVLAGCGNKGASATNAAATAGSAAESVNSESVSKGTDAAKGKLDYNAKGKTYAFLFKAAGNPNGEKQMEGFKKVIEQYGGTAVLKAPDAATVEGQITMINELVAQHVDCIAITGNDVNALQPALQAAMKSGIKVLSTDGQVNPQSRQVHVNQADSKLVGSTLAKGVSDMIKDEGKIAVLSATSDSANQNTWIKYMQEELKANHPKVEVAKVVYGDDESQKSVDETQALIKNYPDLKAIVAPTTVGISAAAKVVKDKGLTGKIFVTGLGLPSEMAEYIESGVCPYMYLWNPDHVGALTAYTSMALVDGKITGTVGDKFEGQLSGEKETTTFGVVKAPDGGTEVLLGKPFEFNKQNINDWKDVF